MAGGTWDATALPVRAGLYINFTTAAATQIQGGARGTVAIPLKTYGTATAERLYRITKLSEAIEAFGEVNVQSIKFALSGGAKEVLVYTMSGTDNEANFTKMLDALETQQFNVFVFDGNTTSARQTIIKDWVVANRSEGKHFMAVFGAVTDADDATPATGNARSIALSDDYIVNLINGVVIGETSYSSAKFAPYVAGLIAGTAINKSTTYAQVSADDVTKRLKNSEVKTALEAGSFVLVFDGDKVKVEKGISTSKDKIRTVRARQAISTDVTKTANDSFIGKIDNNKDGQAALISAIKAYLETLENANVLSEPVVKLSTTQASVGDSVFLDISYGEVDSVERIFLTITI